MIEWCRFGFSRIKETALPELDAILYYLKHNETGLELIWLSRDEENKTFGIAFETLPWNDTGVFHILEHSVLCGSKKYPVKEPFVELMKRSMKTFLNAMTFQDKTFYPVSSRNDKDFINLMRVYLDAVFCPAICGKPEIFYQEGWHYELDEEGKISYKGVVFNEMKGAFAGADRRIAGGLNRLLFPDSPYRFDSGGDPAVIPDLSYEEFIDAYHRFYTPSNGYVFLDGNLDIEQVLTIINDEYLCRYQEAERFAPPEMQAAVSGQSEGVYELASGENSEGKIRMAFGKVIGTFADREKIVAMKILSNALCGTNRSPLCKAIVSEGLAEDVSMSVNDGILQPWVCLELKNIREDAAEKAERLLWDSLTELAEGGLDHALLEAVMANFEFQMRERDYGLYPQGLILGFNVLESWLYGGDPAANLQVGDLFVNLKSRLAEGYFENLIREMILCNPHSAKIVLRPCYTAGEKRREEERVRIDRETAVWSMADREAMIECQEKLMAWQRTEDSPEKLAMIPQLSLQDIPTEPEDIPTKVSEIAGIPVIRHELHTGGVAYVNLYFDADSCTEEEMSCLSFLTRLLGQSDTKEHSAEQIINTTRLLCGNFSVYPSAYIIRGDDKNVTTKLCVSFSTLEANLEKSLCHALEILLESILDDNTAHDILRQTKMEMLQRIVMAGHSVAMGRIQAQFSPGGAINEYCGGLCYYDWLKKQDENWNFADLRERMSRLLKRLINLKALTVSVSGAKGERIEAVIRKVAPLIPKAEVPARVKISPWGKRKEGIILPADVSFAVIGGNFKDEGGQYCGQMQLASQVISLGYMWNAVRVQGGAYGTGMIVQDNGLMGCYSYRDPNGAVSLEKYRNCAAFLREFSQCDVDLAGYIISVISSASPLMTPKMKAQVGDNLYFTQTGLEDRRKNRRQILSATAQDFFVLADVIEKTIENGGICIAGGQEQLRCCKDLDHILSL